MFCCEVERDQVLENRQAAKIPKVVTAATSTIDVLPLFMGLSEQNGQGLTQFMLWLTDDMLIL